MKIKEILGYLGGFIVGLIITRQVLLEFNSEDLVSWLLLIPTLGFDILLSIHFLQRLIAEKNG